MAKIKIGEVSTEETEEIRKLYERKIGLQELLPSLNKKLLDEGDKQEELYEKIVKDLGRTSVLFQSWWDEKSAKYNWQGTEKGRWSIDFNTNEIFLITDEALN